MMNLLLIADVAGERVAFPAADVEAVVEIEAIVPVPQAPNHVAGLAALRSRVLTVIDCRACLQLGSSEAKPTHDAIVTQIDGHPYALLVESVEDVIEFEGDVSPIRGSVAGCWKQVSTGMVETEQGLMLLIDADALLDGAAARAAQTDAAGARTA